MNWIQSTASAAFGNRGWHSSVVFNGKMWVIGGQGPAVYSNDVWSSPDGITWTQVLAHNASPGPNQFTGRYSHASVVFNGLMWVIGGSSLSGSLNDVWSSPDGITWTQVLADNASPGVNQFKQVYGHTVLAFNSLLWVLAGNDGNYKSAWSSPDGITWTKATGALPVSRMLHSSVVYNSLMWVLAGSSNLANGDNRVYYTFDSGVWTQAPALAPFPNREYQSAVTFNNFMWVLGGAASSAASPQNDVWYSSDGATWIQPNVTTPFPAREAHTSVVFNSAMWVIGGFNGGSTTADVWHSP